MGRILKILAIAVILFLVYMFVSALYKSSVKQSTTSQKPAKEKIMHSDELSSSDEFKDDFSNSSDFEKDRKNSALDEAESIIEQTQKKKSGDEGSWKTEKPSDPPKENIKKAPQELPKPNIPPGSTTGAYLAITGSFSNPDNADRMVDKLKKMGYRDAEVIISSASDNFIVTAGRYNDKAAADQVVAGLKARGVDSYVKKR
jgi:cell division septation protein DedD